MCEKALSVACDDYSNQKLSGIGTEILQLRASHDFSPNISQIMLDLACLLIPQEIFPQSAVITDTPLLRKFPCETNILRDIGANL